VERCFFVGVGYVCGGLRGKVCWLVDDGFGSRLYVVVVLMGCALAIGSQLTADMSTRLVAL